MRRTQNTAAAIFVMGMLCIGVLHAGQRSEAYRSTISDQAGSKLKLNNGAEVRVIGGGVGRVGGVRSECILFRSGMRWKIWIEGDDLYDCSVDEQPNETASYAEEVRILEIKYNGDVLLMEDGSIYEVDRRDAGLCARWRGDSDAVIVREQDLINYDDPREVVRVHKLR